MMKKIGRIGAALMLLALPLFAIVPAQSAYAAANAKEEICEGLGGSGGDTCDVNDGGPTINTVIRNVINIFSVFAAIAAVIMIIIGGFRYVTSQGDSGTVSSAKNTIIYAVIGLIVVSVAQTLVRFVLDKAV